MRRFVYHSFAIHTQPDINVFEARQLILDTLEQESKEFVELAKRYHTVIVRHSGMAIPSPSFSVRITTTNLAKSCFSITIFCPTNKAVELEQKITKEFFAFYYEKKRLVKGATITDE